MASGSSDRWKAIRRLANRLDVYNVPSSVGTWVAAHPLLIANGVIFLTPGLLTSPLLAVVGFGAQGPVAGSIAAGLQAGIGNVGAGTAFAYAQSAAMAGYGIGAVNGIVQACAVGSQATAWWIWKK